jgi:HAD superfamily hydrolase (TIGR01458 family)
MPSPAEFRKIIMVDITVFDDTELFILDVDGVLVYDSKIVPGAKEAIMRLRSAGKHIRLLTNDSRSSRNSRAQELRSHGYDFPAEHIYTASYITARYLESLGSPPTLLLTSGSAIDDFRNIPLVSKNPEYVVIGDFFDLYSQETLQNAFDAVMNGAKLIATQKNRYCPGHNNAIDIGFWVAGLEYSTGTKAKVMGKPSADSYQAVINDVGMVPTQAAMVSDDWASDLTGAHQLGLVTILIGRHDLANSEPDFQVDNMFELSARMDNVII